MSSRTLSGRGCLIAAVCLLSAPAEAHVTLEQSSARADTTYKAVLRIPHGCDGAATTAVRVLIPEGLIAVKPMPKAGWTLTTRRGPYAKDYAYFGKPMSEGVVEITWSGGQLADPGTGGHLRGTSRAPLCDDPCREAPGWMPDRATPHRVVPP